jgi:hypothetical protein
VLSPNNTTADQIKIVTAKDFILEQREPRRLVAKLAAMLKGLGDMPDLFVFGPPSRRPPGTLWLPRLGRAWPCGLLPPWRLY